MFRRGNLARPMSSGEMKIRIWLKSNNIEFVSEKHLDGCVSSYSNCPLFFDFYVPNLNLVIEFDGIQHVKQSYEFHKTRKDFIKQRMRDSAKNKFCSLNNIKLLRIEHHQINSIYKILADNILPMIKEPETKRPNNVEEDSNPFQESQAVF